ncbi:MAG: EAL domain-containing protein [Gammaproteobacteria bacterium]|nr:EAL domain-containing protein [Gammaproteobacteria bacterium]
MATKNINKKPVKLSLRLTLLIAMMTIPLIISAIGGYYVYSQIQSALEDTAEDTLYELIPLSNLQIALLAFQMPANDYLIHGNINERENYRQLEKNTIDAFVAVLNANLTPDQATEINKVQNLWLEINSLAKKILVTPDPVGNSTASIDMEKMDALVDEANIIINSLTIYTLSEIEDEFEKIHKSQNQFNLGGLIVISISLLLALISIYLLRNFITIPIKDLEDGTNEFLQGNLGSVITVHRNDELGQLAATLNEMATSLNNSLELNSKRTQELEFANKKIQNESENHKQTASKMKRFMQAIEKTDDYIIFTDMRGVIEYTNPAIQKATGYSKEELLNTNVNIFRSDNHDNDFYKNLWDTILSGQSFRNIFINRKKDGSLFFEEKTITPVNDDAGKLHYVATGRDITEQMQTHEQLHYLAHHDALTGLGNRIMMMDRLEHALDSANRNEHMVGILFLDLDRFKNINDSLGHSVGDLLLKEIAKRLEAAVRSNDIIARLGGDEFVVIAEKINHIDDLIILSERLIKTISTKINVKDHELFITTSIGMTIYPLDDDNPEGLIKHADSAMYTAKETGRNTYAFFTQEMTDIANARIKLESDLRKALHSSQLLLYYQPKVNLKTGTIIGLEALLRWQTPDKTIHSPAKFIPVLEETGLIHEVGEWVIKQACLFIKKLDASGFNDLSIAVNLSAKQFSQNNLIETISEIINNHDINGSRLELEITENLLVANINEASETLSLLSKLGIHIAIDDFGTGYSSLSYLKKLPIDTLKIDRSFVKDIGHDEEDQAIISAIIGLAKTLKLNIVAEGVETQDQHDFLALNDCHIIQGFFYSPPLPEDEILSWLKDYSQTSNNALK